MAEFTKKSIGFSEDTVCCVEAETSRRAMKNKKRQRLPAAFTDL